MWRRHARALYLLALVQLWERFACFASLPLLVLYLQQVHGLPPDVAVMVFGGLQALSYLGGLPGGLLADGWLGRRLGAFLGTVLLLLGYGALALDWPGRLGAGLALLVAGHALFKPAFHAVVGGLYSDNAPRRESGFLLLHVVFNLGAAVAPAVAEWARACWGWAAVFQVAALGMLASTTCFALGAAALRPTPRSKVPLTAQALPPSEESARIRACRRICGLGVVFWLAAVQPCTSLTLFAAQHTELRLSVLGRALIVAPGHFLSLHALLVIVLAPPLGWLLSGFRQSGKGISTPGKMAWGFVATSAAFAVLSLAGLRGGDTGRIGLGWLGGGYVLLTLGELLLAPMGLALVTRLSPSQKTSRMVALWFAATAAGNELAGLLGFVWTRWPHHRYFALLAGLSLGAAARLLVWLRALESLLPGSPSARGQACEAGGEPRVTQAPDAPGASPTNSRRLANVLVSLSLIAPLPLIGWDRLPLQVRAISAIGCGLAVLLCGSYLIAQAMDWQGGVSRAGGPRAERSRGWERSS